MKNAHLSRSPPPQTLRFYEVLRAEGEDGHGMKECHLSQFGHASRVNDKTKSPFIPGHCHFSQPDLPLEGALLFTVIYFSFFHYILRIGVRHLR